jgi:hypothetical protein
MHQFHGIRVPKEQAHTGPAKHSYQTKKRTKKQGPNDFGFRLNVARQSHTLKWIRLLGSNDSKPVNWAYQTNYVPDYERMIAHYRNLPTHPRIYLNTLLTAYGAGNYGITDPIVTGVITPWIKQIGFDEGCPVIDINAATKNMPQNFPDNIHPDIAGAQVVAETVFYGLMRYGETPPVFPELACTLDGAQIQLSWPPDHIGWRLEAQTNGLGTNWGTVSGSSATNRISFLPNTTGGDVFFRLSYP